MTEVVAQAPYPQRYRRRWRAVGHGSSRSSCRRRVGGPPCSAEPGDQQHHAGGADPPAEQAERHPEHEPAERLAGPVLAGVRGQAQRGRGEQREAERKARHRSRPSRRARHRASDLPSSRCARRPGRSARPAGRPAAGGPTARGLRPAPARVRAGAGSSSAAKRRATVPNTTTSPRRSGCGAPPSRCPFTKVPPGVPRSCTQVRPSRLVSTACWGPTWASVSRMSQPIGAADELMLTGQQQRTPVVGPGPSPTRAAP